MEEDVKKDLEEIKKDVKNRENNSSEASENVEPQGEDEDYKETEEKEKSLESKEREEEAPKEEVKKEDSEETEEKDKVEEREEKQKSFEETEEETDTEKKIEKETGDKKEDEDKSAQEAVEEAESLVEELKKEEEKPKEVEEEKKQRGLKKFLPIIGLALLSVFLILGVAISIKLLIAGFSEKPKKRFHRIEKNLGLEKPLKEHKPEKVAEIPKKPKIKLPKIPILKKPIAEIPSKPPPTPLFPFQLNEFLIPIGNSTFLSLRVTLYFDLKTKYEDIVNSRLEYRKAIYYAAKVIPLNMWFKKKLRHKVEEAFLKMLKEKKVEPLPKKIKLMGIVFKG